MTSNGGPTDSVDQNYLEQFQRRWRRDTELIIEAEGLGGPFTPAQSLYLSRLIPILNSVYRIFFVDEPQGDPLGHLIPTQNLERLAARLSDVAVACISPSPGELTKYILALLDEISTAFSMMESDAISEGARLEYDAMAGARTLELARQVQRLNSFMASAELSELLGEANQAVTQISESKTEAQEARNDTVEAAGQTGAVSLGRNFYRFGRWEEIRAWIMRVISGLLFGSSVYLGVKLSEDLKDAKFLTWEVARFAVVVPILLFAYYFLREASHHRDAAREARLNSVLLQSIKAYTDELNGEDKYLVRAELGRRVFGRPERSAAVLPDSSDLIDPKDATSLVGAITALLGVALKK